MKSKNVSKQNRRHKRNIDSLTQTATKPVPTQSSLQSYENEYLAIAARIMARSHKRQQEEEKTRAQQTISSSFHAPLPQPETVLDNCEKAKASRLPEAVQLPPKRPDDGLLRLEQNLGCELPVCVANRRDVKKEAIEIRTGNNVVWRLERTASSLLAAPEHHPIWLWLLDRFQAAATHYKCIEAPRIPVNLTQLAKNLGRKPNGQWYKDVDEALARFSRMVITAGQSLHVPSGQVINKSGAFGTLCDYVSWRTESPKERQSLIEGGEGWVQPGPFIWASIRSGYLKAVPLLPLRSLQSYVAQRLFLYLGKHCRPGGQYKVSISKLLPKIPMNCPTRNVKIKLQPHHQALLDIGFLASEPVYEGRGTGLMVIYERPLG